MLLFDPRAHALFRPGIFCDKQPVFGDGVTVDITNLLEVTPTSTLMSLSAHAPQDERDDAIHRLGEMMFSRHLADRSALYKIELMSDVDAYIQNRERRTKLQPMYEKYRLRWMLGHDYCLSDLKQALIAIDMDADESYMLSVHELWDRFEVKYGFGDERIPSFDDWANSIKDGDDPYTPIKPGDYVCYNRRHAEYYRLGVVKRRNDTDDGWFVWYNTDNTATNTPDDCLYRIMEQNDPTLSEFYFINDGIKPVAIGGEMRQKMFPTE